MKKRVRNKNHKLLIKRKNSSWIILNNEKFLLSFLLLGIFMVGLFVTLNSPAYQNAAETGELAANAPSSIFTSDVTKFYNDYIRPLIVPEGMQGFGGFLIGIISLVLVFTVMMDIILLVSPLSKNANWIIGVGLGISMIAFGWTVSIAGWVVGWGSTLFAWAGVFSIALIIIMSIGALVFIFFGYSFLAKWAIMAKSRRMEIDKTNKAMEAATDIKALKKLAKGAIKP